MANILKSLWVAFETLNVVGGLCLLLSIYSFLTFCPRGGYEIVFLLALSTFFGVFCSWVMCLVFFFILFIPWRVFQWNNFPWP